MSEPRKFEELRETGLVWLLNASVFHPRGYAFALHIDDDGVATGWSLTGDGSAPWSFAESTWDDIDKRYAAIKELMP